MECRDSNGEIINRYYRVSKKVLDCIASEEIDKFFGATYFKNLPESDMCKQAMIYGMTIAAMMTSRCDHVIIKV